MTATTTSADLTAQLQSDEVWEIQRRRRELVTALEERRQDCGRLQAKLKALGGQVEEEGISDKITAAQDRLELAKTARAAAETALRDFDESNPSEQELQRRAAEIERQRLQEARDKITSSFKAKIRKALAQLIEASEILADAKKDFDAAPRGTFNNGPQADELTNLLETWPKWSPTHVPGRVALIESAIDRC